MNSVTAGQKGGSRGSESDAVVLRAEIQGLKDDLNTEERLRKTDRDTFAKKVAEYGKLVEKKEADLEKMKRKVQDFDEMKAENAKLSKASANQASELVKLKLEMTDKAKLLKEQSAVLELSKKAVKDCQADITKERDKVKNLEDAVKSMELISAKREADLLERESELAKLKIEHVNLSEKSMQQESEMSNLKAHNADLLDKAGQRELQFVELKAENAKLSKASAEQATELLKLKNFMADLSAQTATLSSFAQNNIAQNVCRADATESVPAEIAGANDEVRMEAVVNNLAMATITEDPARLQSNSDAQVEESSKSDEKISDGTADPQLEIPPLSATTIVQTPEKKISSDASKNQDAVADASLPDIPESNASILALLEEEECKILAAANQRAAAGCSGVETLSFEVPENGDADSIHDANLSPKTQEECNAEMIALWLGPNHTKSPAGDEKAKNDNGPDECKSTAALCGRDSKSECARSSNAGSASGFDSSSVRKGAAVSSSEGNGTIFVESDDSQRKQRKRKPVSRKESISSSKKRFRLDTTATPPTKSNLNRKEGRASTSSANKKSKHSKSGSSACRSDKRKSHSKGKGDRIGRARSREAAQRKNPPIDQRRASQIYANRHPPRVEPLASSHHRPQFQQPIPFRGGGHHGRGSNGNGSFHQQQRHTHRGAWQQGRHYPAKPENGRDAGPNRNQNH